MILKIGLPHSDIHGSKGARPSPQLFAACHVLHRLLAPRHPPDALFNASFSHSLLYPCPENEPDLATVIRDRSRLTAFLLDSSLKQISCLDQCRIHMSHKSPRTHDQTYWHTSDRSMPSHTRACKNIRAREPHKPFARTNTCSSSEQIFVHSVRPRCPRKSSSTMSMNVRPLQKTEVRDQGSGIKPSSLTSSFLFLVSCFSWPKQRADRAGVSQA